MTFPKKRYLLPLMGLAGLLLFFVTLAVVLPRLLPLDSVKRDIESRMSLLAGGKITYADANLKYAPWPQLVFRKSAIEIPGKMSGTIDSLVVIPKLIPLLTGTIEIARLSATAPQLRLELPPEEPVAPPRSLSLPNSAGALAAMISGIGNSVREKLVIHISKGRIEFVTAVQPALSYQDISGNLHFSPDRVRMEINGGSAKDEKIAFGLDFDPGRLSGRGHLKLKRFLPENVHRLLFPHADIRLGDSRIDLEFDLTAETPEKFSGTLAGALPLFSLTRGEETLPFGNGSFTVAFAIDKDRTELSLSKLTLARPALNLTGRFLSDEAASNHQWEITATELALSDAGESARFLFGHLPLVQTLCAVLKDGRVHNIEVKDAASSLADLRKVGNLSIHGFLEKGTVYIPAPDLTLTDATGWVDVHDGILEGKELRAQLGNARGHGSYRMALSSGEETPFFIDTLVDADLSELPPLLHRLVGNKIFKREMTGVAEAKGTAEGRLIIDHTHQGTAVTVDVSRFNLTGRYGRIPYPFTLTEGAFHYDAQGVRVEALRGNIGASAFSGLTAHIGTSSPFQLDIATGPIAADMAQVHPWLKSYDAIAPHLLPYESVTGLISAKSLLIKGPALNPKNWQFSVRGDVKDLRVITPALPSPMTIRSGSFSADPETLVFDHTTFETMDTTLQAEGRCAGYLKNEQAVETTLTGTLGANAAAWVREKMGIPSGLSWQSPLLLTPIRLHFNQHGEVSVSGALGKPNGPAVELTLNRTPQRLAIERLRFQDEDSDGTFSMRSENNIIDLGFKGKLHEKTLNTFFTGTPFLSGHIEGDFNSRFLYTKPYLAAAKGYLHIGQLDFSPFNWPLTIHQASLAGTGNDLKILNARLTWLGSSFQVDGTVNGFQQGLNLDLTTAVEKIDWPQISALLVDKSGTSEKKTLPLWQRFPLYGNIAVHADTFAYSEKLTFHPFEALVSFAGNQVTVSVSEAQLCGLSLTGTLTHSPDYYQLDAKLTAAKKDLATSLACVWGNKKIIDGHFQLDGQLSGKGNKETRLMDALTGEMSFTATQGRIHRFGFFAKIFTLLNVAGLLKGEVPDLDREGFPYKTARATATLENGKLKIKEGEIDSSAMRIFFSGEENLSAKTHDLTIVVAPLSTVDLLVRHIPLVRNVLDKGVVIYPITATGTWEDPQLNLLSPTAVSEQIWGVVIRTLKLPLDILKPVISGEKKKAPDAQ